MTRDAASRPGVKRLLVERGRYFDSVFLLRISRALEELPGVRQAVVAMGTPANLENLERVGFEIASAGPQAGPRPDDLIIAVEADDEAALVEAERKLVLLLAAGSGSGETTEELPSTLGDAVSVDAAANLALISVPGVYAAAEARRALRRGLHVMLFSDNVAVEDEVALKDAAARRGLLVMGPDCGTAIVNGVPLGFANVVRRGPIGIVGASGTGIQEVTSLIDRAGGGVSQALGTGGRDLSHAVGARSTLAAIGALAADPETRVVVVVSKAPAPEVAERVLANLAASGKPAVVHFVGTAGQAPRGCVAFAETLAETARAACKLAGVAVPDVVTAKQPEAHFPAREGQEPRLLCGLFCGGTLAQEAWVTLRRRGIDVRSNVAADPAFHVAPGDRVTGHVLWDLGDDAFTVGRPHPMIEPALRDAEVARALADPNVAVVLVDCVLGYGAHPDPAGSLAQALERTPSEARLVASVTGTDRDPQGYREQRRRLEAAGVLVADSNAQAAEWVAAMLCMTARGEATR
ncbi:MAG: acyl-CoA synthetase FdrA [Candidatus Bipolaricaulota bacterium]|nr:acyl-CoA synthetase FdrA [Candidatus Bipolaricaulota bacterium]